ncbi:MAG: hypothetical protein MJK04_27800 [Psychrosphaera sp.]|nr:hypothetical protein [Psychrosphaera sp.]
MLQTSVVEALSKEDVSFELENVLELNGVEPVISKVGEWVGQMVGNEVEYLIAFIFLASDSTMNFGKPHSVCPSWHTDLTNRWVDGDCFNAWIPLYINAQGSGVSIISEMDNPLLYSELDPTYKFSIYTREKQSAMFDLLAPNCGPQIDMMVVTMHNGVIKLLNSDTLNIRRFDNAFVGDVGLFNQGHIHGGFHQKGIRIQLSLKFRVKTATLNKKPSNELFKVFENVQSQGFALPLPKNNCEEFEAFNAFRKNLLKRDKLTKHANLKIDLIKALLSSNTNR